MSSDARMRVAKAIKMKIREGMPYKQAAAEALEMERAGRLNDDGQYVHVGHPKPKHGT